MIQIIPSLLDRDEQTFLKHLDGLGQSVDMVQIDIADGIFVPHTTWADPEIIKKHLQTDCELHLMVADPVVVAKQWQGVPQVKRILVHYEAIESTIDATLAQLIALGWNISLVLNPETPDSVLDLHLDFLDGVMFMGVHPGEQGNPFVPEVLDKIKAFKAGHPDCFVELDGGINDETLPEIIKSGVDAICPGHAVFGNERSPEDNVERMRNMIERLTN